MSLIFPDGSRTVPLGSVPRGSREDRIRQLTQTGVPAPPNAMIPRGMDGVSWVRQRDGSYAPAGPQQPQVNPSQRTGGMLGYARDFMSRPSLDPGFEGNSDPRQTPDRRYSRPGAVFVPGYGWIPEDSPFIKQMEHQMQMERDRLQMERDKMEMEMASNFVGGREGVQQWLGNRLGSGQQGTAPE